jgi:hypothetical protein
VERISSKITKSVGKKLPDSVEAATVLPPELVTEPDPRVYIVFSF